ncbi:MAG: cyanophycin synthetase, partial [Mucinivorans sp.]
VLRILSELRPVVGRFECIHSDDGRLAIVDYAHTPDALENVLTTINELKGRAQIITVVGCGGDRDATKRPVMAAIAAKLSDRLVLTSDNPRSEEPNSILNQMAAGLDTMAMRHTLIIENRTQAIRTAAALAGKGDIILLAGKGHETYQEINGVRHHFDDKEQIREAFKSNLI